MVDLNSVWFTTMGKTIGIVTMKDPFTKEERAYIGMGKGVDKREDEENIIRFGTLFPIDLLKQII